MRTSVDLPDRLFRQAKALAARRGTTLRELICEGLEAMLAPAATRPFRLEDCSFAGEGLVEGLDSGDWDRMRERIYEGRGG